MTGPPTEQLQPVEERKRGTIMATAARVAVDLHPKSASASAADALGPQMAAKIVRMFVAWAIIVAGYAKVFGPAWDAMLKADSLRGVDVARVGLAVVIFIVGFYVWSPDRTTACVQWMLGQALRWKARPAPTEGAAP